jgi:hypothetical protein
MQGKERIKRANKLCRSQQQLAPIQLQRSKNCL